MTADIASSYTHFSVSGKVGGHEMRWVDNR